jgi:hypothetical protein
MIKDRALLLASLSADARDFWTNADHRRQTLETLHNGRDPDTTAYVTYATLIDNDIADLLVHVGLPCGEVRGVAVNWQLRDVHGAKTPSCPIPLGAAFVSKALWEWGTRKRSMTLGHIARWSGLTCEV